MNTETAAHCPYCRHKLPTTPEGEETVECENCEREIGATDLAVPPSRRYPDALESTR